MTLSYRRGKVRAMSEDLRATAEQHLRALAGDAAVLRDDQWTAIEALVSGRRRALVVQRTGGASRRCTSWPRRSGRGARDQR